MAAMDAVGSIADLRTKIPEVHDHVFGSFGPLFIRLEMGIISGPRGTGVITAIAGSTFEGCCRRVVRDQCTAGA